MTRLAAYLLPLLGCALGAQTADYQDSVRAAMASSIEKQRASVQKQAGSIQAAGEQQQGESGFFTVPWPQPAEWKAIAAGLPVCDPMPKQELDKLVSDASGTHAIDAKLVQAVIDEESASRPCAVSPAGAQGLMQLMPSTADQLGVSDPFDPKQNVEAGTRLLKQLLTKYNGDIALALGAYNAGSGRVDREGGVPPIPETVRYVSDILSRFKIE